MNLCYNSIPTFLFLISFAISSFANDITKHALLIGVGDYEASTGWDKLSAVNDVELISNALINQGFLTNNIHTLLDKEVSKENVFQVIENQLIAKVKEGDIVIFHYSGHGQQIQDDNGDELDGLDEAIVPFDSPKKYEAGVYEGEKLIRDEDLGKLFSKLRKKLGNSGQLLVIMDACHSGTGTRGIGKARGTNQIMASSDYKKKLNLKTNDDHQLEGIEIVDKGIAPMISLFSSTAKQLSYEMDEEGGKSYGLLSYAFSKYFNELTEQTTYEGLMANIKMFIATQTSLQTPQVEGARDLTVMGGKILPRLDYFQAVEYINKTIITLNNGSVQGLYEGTKVALYPLDTRDTVGVKPISTGEIVYTEPFLSEIELDTPLEKNTALAAWIFIKEKNYGGLKVKLQIDLPPNAFIEDFKKKATAIPSLEIVEEQADLILQKKNNQIQLINKDQYLLFEGEELTGKKLINICLMSAQAHFLRKLDMKDNRFEGTLQLMKDGEPSESFDVGDQFEIEIQNTGTEAFYFNLLDIQPDNILNVLPLSDDERSIEEYYLEPGKIFTSQLMQIGNPSGTEVFKLITTNEPIDISNIIITKGSNTKGGKSNPFEVLMSDIYANQNTKGTSNVRPGTAGVYTKVFLIKAQ